MDFKEILGVELVAKLDEAELTETILKKLGEAKLIEDDGSMVPKADWIPRKVYNEDKAKLQELLEQRTAQLEDLKEELKSTAGAAERIEELQRKNKEADLTYKQQLKAAKVTAAVEVALIKAGAKHPDLLKGLIDPEKVTEIEGKFIGVEEQINLLKQGSYKDLFGEIVLEGEPPIDGKQREPETKAGKLQKEYDELVKQFGKSSPQAITAKNKMFQKQLQPSSLAAESTEGV